MIVVWHSEPTGDNWVPFVFPCKQRSYVILELTLEVEAFLCLQLFLFALFFSPLVQHNSGDLFV